MNRETEEEEDEEVETYSHFVRGLDVEHEVLDHVHLVLGIDHMETCISHTHTHTHVSVCIVKYK